MRLYWVVRKMADYPMVLAHLMWHLRWIGLQSICGRSSTELGFRHSPQSRDLSHVREDTTHLGIHGPKPMLFLPIL